MFPASLTRGLVRKGIAVAVAAGAAFVAICAVGAAIFFGLCLVVVPWAAALITALLFAVIALIVVLVFVQRDGFSEEPEEDQPLGLGERAYELFRNRPILGTVAALAGGYIFLRNPALATMVAAAFTEKSRNRPRR